MTARPPTLVLVAHGSAAPEAADAADALTAALADRRPDVPVILAYLDHGEPRLNTLLPTLPPGPVALVPYLLAHAFHLPVDIEAAAHAARATGRPIVVADVLAPHPLLLDALDALLAAAAVPPDAAVVLAAAGTSHDDANGVLRDVGRQLAARRAHPVTAAFASAATPTVDAALAALPPGPAAVVPWVLFPGRFAQTIAAAAAAAGAMCTEILGSHPAIVDVVWERYDAAVALSAALSRRNES